MKAEIIAVGTEILLGEITNTNAQYIAKKLANLGIFVYYQTVVGDNPKRLKEIYKQGFQRADLLITTGGLGPTQDDLTKEIAADYFQKKMIFDDFSWTKIQHYFMKRNVPLVEGNKKQAFFPEEAYIIPNSKGTAPGCIIEKEGKILILLPGPPSEMIPMFEEFVIPYLQKFQEEILVSKVVHVVGIGESQVEEQLEDIIKKQTNPTIAPYATKGEVRLRLTARSKTKEEGLALIEPIEKEIRKRLGVHVYGVNSTTLEEELVRLLLERKYTISLAESCTGGMICSRLVNCSGVSQVLIEGAVTYSNDAKKRRLGVKSETLEQYGAVSEETAREMAIGIAKAAQTDISLSVTGIAGPEGGSQEKPVGLVYISIYYHGKVKVRKCKFSGTRQQIRERVTIEALDWLRQELLK